MQQTTVTNNAGNSIVLLTAIEWSLADSFIRGACQVERGVHHNVHGNAHSDLRQMARIQGHTFR